MKSSQKFLLLVALVGGVATLTEGVTVTSSVASFKSKKSSSSSSEPTPLHSKPENAFLRLAKSVAYQALDEFREEGRRNPRFGMTVNLTSLFNNTDGFNATGLEGLAALAGVPVAIKFSSLGLKGALIGGLVGLKAFIIQIAISILWLAFLISGTAYFVCNLGLISCGQGLGGLGGGLTGGGGAGGVSSLFGSSGSPPYGGGSSHGGSSSSSGFSNPLGSFFSSRSGQAAVQQMQEQATPIFKAIDEGYKKYQ